MDLIAGLAIVILSIVGCAMGYYLIGKDTTKE